MALVLESSRPPSKPLTSTSQSSSTTTSESSSPSTTSTNVFNWGKYVFDSSTVQKSVFSYLDCFKSIFSCLGCCNICSCLPNCSEEHEKKYPPKEIFIVHPIKSGTYPVLLFFPGTSLVNSFYSQLFKHISSHGFIVVAPQLCGLIPPPACVELNSAEDVADWLIKYRLEGHLPDGVEPDFSSGLALAGHSRGGRTAFALADKRAAVSAKKEAAGNVRSRLLTKSGRDLNLSVLIGVDPVAACMCCATMPAVNPETDYFEFDTPVAVIGSGLGGDCAPKSGNYAQFFKRSKPPKRVEFLAPQYGHMDVLDDNPAGDGSCFSCVSALMTKFMCANAKGRSRECMSRTVGGIVVAFFRAYDNTSPDPKDLNAIENDLSLAPAELVIPNSDAAGQLALET